MSEDDMSESIDLKDFYEHMITHPDEYRSYASQLTAQMEASHKE